MAENKWTGSANRAADIIDEDDPFAALTRLVDADTAARRPTEHPESKHQDFAMDLEDELLREFERYDSGDQGASAPAPQGEMVPDSPAVAEETETETETEEAETETVSELDEIPHTDEDAEVEELLEEAELAEIVVADFSGPVPDVEIEREPEVSFDGPVPDFDNFELDDEDTETSFDGPVPDFDFDADFSAAPAGGDVLDSIAIGEPEESAEDLMAGELEMSLGINEKEEPAGSEPVSAFAEWKNERLSMREAQQEPKAPAWVPGPVLGQPGVDLAEGKGDLIAEVSPETTPEAVDQLSEGPDVESAIETAEAAEAPRFEDPLLELQAIMAGSGSPKAETADVAAADAIEPAGDADLDIDFDTLEMDLASVELDGDDVSAGQFDDTVMADDLPFDPDQITEIEPAAEFMADLEVPSVPAVDKEPAPAARNDFDYEFEAEMAHLFGQSDEVGDDDSSSPETFAETDGEQDPFEKELEDDIVNNLHAAGISGGFINPEDLGEEPAPAERNRRGGRWMTLAAIAAALVVIAGAYTWINSTGETELAGSGGEPPIVMADDTPFKEIPADKGGAVVPNQDKAVYDKVEGNADETVKQQSLIESTEEPLDVAEQTSQPETLPLDGEDNDVVGVTDSGTEDRLLPENEEAMTAESNQSAAVIAPRKVKTMIVMPDGTLVARETPEPAVPVKSGEATAANGNTTAGSTEPEIRTAAANEGVAPGNDATVSQSAVEEVAKADVDVTAPVRPVKITTITSAPVPEARPTDQPVNVVGTVSDSGKVNEKPTPAAESNQPAAETQVASLPAGTYVVQIASLTSEESARKTYNNLAARFSSVIGGLGVDIRRADIEGKGTYYRVRIPAGTREKAIALCERYKAAGGSCLVSK